jgi:hypothetical protein
MTEEKKIKEPKIFRSSVLEVYRAVLKGNPKPRNLFISKFGAAKHEELTELVIKYKQSVANVTHLGGRAIGKSPEDKMFMEEFIEGFLKFVKDNNFKFYVRGEKDPEVETPLKQVIQEPKRPIEKAPEPKPKAPEPKPTAPAPKPKAPVQTVIKTNERQAPPSIDGLNEQATKRAKEKVAEKSTKEIPSEVDDFMSNAEDSTPIFSDFQGLCEVASKYGAKFILSKSLVDNYQRTTEQVKETYDKDILRSLGIQVAEPSSGATSKSGAKFNLKFIKLGVAHKTIPVIQYATKTVYAQGSPHMESLALLIDESKLKDFQSEFAVNFDFKVPHEKLAKTDLAEVLERFHTVDPKVKYGVYGFKLSGIPLMDDERLQYFSKIHISNVYSAVFKQHLANQLKKLGKEVLKCQVSDVEKVKSLHPAYVGRYTVAELEALSIDPSTMAIKFEDSKDESEESVVKELKVSAPMQVYVGIDFIFPRINSKINLTGKKLLEGGEAFITAVGLLEQVCLPKDRKAFETFKKACNDLQRVGLSCTLGTDVLRKIEKAIKTCEKRESRYKILLHYVKAIGFINKDLSMSNIFSSDGSITRGYCTYMAQVNSPLGKTHYNQLGFKLKG